MGDTGALVAAFLAVFVFGAFCGIAIFAAGSKWGKHD